MCVCVCVSVCVCMCVCVSFAFGSAPASLWASHPFLARFPSLTHTDVEALLPRWLTREKMEEEKEEEEEEEGEADMQEEA